MRIKFFDDDDKEIGGMYLTTRGKDHPFSSGSVGYNGSGKLDLPSVRPDRKGAARHQVSINLVEVGTKGIVE